MASISVRAGDCLTIGGDTVVQIQRTRGEQVRLNIDAAEEVSVVRGAAQEPDEAEIQERLQDLAREIVSDLSALEAAHSKELLGAFVSELFLSVAEQSRREERRQKQAQGIAAAKARGGRFGRPAPPLPENFDEARRAWRNGELTVREAADSCGMSHSSFYHAAVRRERSEEEAV